MLATLTSLASFASVAGFGAVGSSSASASTETSAALRDSEASDCAKLAENAPSATVAQLVCTDLVSDLGGIAKLLELPPLAPTDDSATSPVEVDFSAVPADRNPTTALMETKYFSTGIRHTLHPCKVVLYPLAWKEFLPNDTSLPSGFHVLLSHEAVHCYQHTVISYEEDGGDRPGSLIPEWISEGVATYVATISAGPEPATDTFWGSNGNGWLGKPNKNLTERNYDAVGWYAMVARATDTSILPKFKTAWRAYIDGGYSDDAFIKALGGDDPRVEAAWAPSLLHSEQWGPTWDTPGIGVPTGLKPRFLYDSILQQDVPVQVPINSYAAVVDDESTVTDGLVEVSIDNGLASVHDFASTDEVGFTDQLFCVGKACDTKVTCQSKPSKNTPDHITPIPLTVPFYVAAGGSNQAGVLTMESMSVPDDPSTPVQLHKGDGLCPGSAGFSEGDPHILTLNGGYYDFQGAGEYTLVRSANGDVDVQVRAQPFEGRTSSVAYNSAVAAKVGSSDVEVDAGDPAVVRVNGKRVTTPIHGSQALGAGTDPGHLSAVVAEGGLTNVVVTWPDGSELDVSAGSLGNDATFVPAGPIDSYSGLLSALVLPKGKARDAATSPDLTLLGGDGHTYVMDPATPAGFTMLYGPFAESWQITPKTSLFTYPKGKSTRSFDIKGFPPRPVTAALLKPAERKKATAACKAAGITGAVLLNDCIIDVGETGKKSFATTTAREAQASSDSTGTTTTTSPPGPSSGSTTTTSTTQPAAGAHPASFYFTHACSAVTKGELEQAVGPVSALSGGTSAVCTFRPNSSALVDSVTFSSQSIGLFKGTHNGKSGSGPVPSLGHGAYCIVSPPYLSGQAYVVASLGSVGSIQVLVGNCTQGTAITKAALGRISGL